MSFIRALDDGMKSLVFNRFKSYFFLDDTTKDIVFAPKDVQMRKIAEKRGNDSVEFIGLWREFLEMDWQRNNSPVARRGLSMEFSDPQSKTHIVTVRAVPVHIKYTIYFWSRDLNKIMDATEKYLFWQFFTPKLVLSFNGKYPLDIQMFYGRIQDETMYSQIYDKGTFFVYSMPVTIDGWVFDQFLSPSVLLIDAKFYYYETTPLINPELLSEYTITT